MNNSINSKLFYSTLGILFLIFILVSFSSSAQAKIIKSQAEVVTEVTGTLYTENTKNQYLAKIESSEGRIFNLQNVHIPWNSCKLGEFVIEKLQPGEMNEKAGWFLVDVIECYDDIYKPQMEKNQWVCPEIYEPVCAQPKMKSCAPGMACAQVMPAPRTYNNLCQMWIDNAEFMSFDTCQNSLDNRY